MDAAGLQQIRSLEAECEQLRAELQEKARIYAVYNDLMGNATPKGPEQLFAQIARYFAARPP